MSSKVTDGFLKKVKSRISRLVNYLIWILVVLLAVSTVRNIGKVGRIRGETAQEQKRIAKMEAENKDLEAQVALTQDPKFVEKEIRNKLGLVKEGEAIVVLPDEDTLRKLAPKIEAEEDTLPDPNWKKWLKLFI